MLAAESPESFEAGEFTFKPPAGWTWVKPSSRMRAAQLEVGKADAKAEVIFFYFGPGSAGGTEANVARWLSQFQEPKEQLNSKVEELPGSKQKITVVAAEGTYLSGRPAGPKNASARFETAGSDHGEYEGERLCPDGWSQGDGGEGSVRIQGHDQDGDGGVGAAAAPD